MWVTPEDSDDLTNIQSQVDSAKSKYFLKPDASLWDRFKMAFAL
jgi:hypothetical protein